MAASVSHHEKLQPAIRWLIYTRTISDNNGHLRFDQNVVPTIRLNKWLFLEAGIRFGETSQKFDSYFHYKLEVQTKSFWRTVRFFARLSDNIIKYQTPDYRKSNYLIVAESEFPLTRSITFQAAGGYVFSYQQNNSTDGRPVFVNGKRNNYPTFKISLKYKLNDKGSVEIVYGAYDVFNPYLLSSPFLQVGLDYELGKRTALYSYARYQYSNQVDVPMNNFLGLGVRIRGRK